MAEKITVYQKPTCSKCRATLAILDNSGESFEAINYYETPLTAERLKALVQKLGVPARDILRSDEPAARQLGLTGTEGMKRSDDEIIQAMADNPDLIQRPIVVRGDRAMLCRPPENVLKLLE